MTQFIRDWGWAILLGTCTIGLIVGTMKSSPDHEQKSRLATAKRGIAGVLPAYETAILIGDMQRACQEATLMNQFAIDSHDAEFAKPFYIKKEEACQ